MVTQAQQPSSALLLFGAWPARLLAFAVDYTIAPQAQTPALGRGMPRSRLGVHQQQIVVVLFLDGVGLDRSKGLIVSVAEQPVSCGLDHFAQFFAIQAEALLDL